MKKLLLIAFPLILSSCFTKKPDVVVAQSNAANTEEMYPGHTTLATQEIAKPVMQSWTSGYSGIKGAQWYKTNDGYIVFYPYKKLQSLISFDTTGKVLTKCREVKAEDVLPEIRTFMKDKYPGTQYGRTYVCTTAEGDKRYEVQVLDKFEIFDMQGKNLEKNKNVNEPAKE